jgi:uncharacterized protein (TIGR02265 family)
MGKVKGTVLVDFVKTIRGDKTGVYDSYLTPADKEIISSRILPSAWYPFDTFKNCFQAVVRVLADNDMEKVRQWGRLYGENIITSVYKGMIKDGQPMEMLEKYRTYIQSFFDFGEFDLERLADNHAVIIMTGFGEDFPSQYYMMAGWIERSLELSGAKDIKSEFVAKTWEGAPDTRLDIKWSV